MEIQRRWRAVALGTAWVEEISQPEKQSDSGENQGFSFGKERIPPHVGHDGIGFRIEGPLEKARHGLCENKGMLKIRDSAPGVSAGF
jgi:hypothetical protein